MICPITKQHCDDECCSVGSECNLGGVSALNEIINENPQASNSVSEETEE